MKYYYLDPEVDCEEGERTVMDPSFHPAIVSRLHVEFNIWPEDVLVACYTCLLCTVSAMGEIRAAGLTGVTFGEVETDKSEQFEELTPGWTLPPFVWMKVHGTQGKDDFGVGQSYKITGYKKHDYHEFTLVVSQTALNLLQRLGLSHAIIEDFKGGASS